VEKYTVKHTDISLEDVENIFQYGIETFGEKAVLNYLYILEKAYEKSGDMPTIGHGRKDIPMNALSFNIEPNTIIYTIDETNKSILVLRVLNSKMNFEEQF
jgi:plasmid stabilization system protein ParE